MIKESTEYLNVLASRIEFQKSYEKFDVTSASGYCDYESSLQVNVMQSYREQLQQ